MRRDDLGSLIAFSIVFCLDREPDGVSSVGASFAFAILERLLQCAHVKTFRTNHASSHCRELFPRFNTTPTSYFLLTQS
eukprot:m.74189 g.74189  ORF g.74189 m.74189 type:complete len:79 (-) comp18875_c0_seq1:156-392(-)